MSSTPTVYFIDDSATMREVIKIAFRRENINVVACQDADTALHEIEQAKPDVVITDVIMPGKDGYEVCQFIKNHASLSKTPVILMSGVVNRAVAERAFAVKADELLRKPFQPQDLITRVKHLLKPNGHETPNPATAASAAAALTSIFSAASAAQQARPPAPQPVPRAAAMDRGGVAGVEVLGPQPVPAAAAPRTAPQPGPIPVPTPAPAASAVPPARTGLVRDAVETGSSARAGLARDGVEIPITAAPTLSKPHANGDTPKLKLEILRLEGLVKKLQSELVAEREYSRALEAHVKTLQEAE
ncbi:MAG TPA: response regulator [Candidatus Angelobacter sp.]|nr:response regulator [Candidatus Angelobacter sp.]